MDEVLQENSQPEPEHICAQQNFHSFLAIKIKSFKGNPLPLLSEGSNNWDQHQSPVQDIQSQPPDPSERGSKAVFIPYFHSFFAVNDPLSAKQHPSEQNVGKWG